MKRNKLFVLGVLAAALTFGMVLAGCDTDNGGGDPGPGKRAEYAIGDPGPGGGKIFYVSTTGFSSNGATCHYLEAAPADLGTNLKWSSGTGYDSYDISGASGTAVGTGAENTAAILAVDANAPAAKVCADYTNGGKSDWFLPSKDELIEMNQNKMAIGNFGATFYWSSSQHTTEWARLVNFDDNSTGGGAKTNSFRVRAVRAF